MTIRKGYIIDTPIIPAPIRIVPFSGIVKNSSGDVFSRPILVFKHGNTALIESRSEADGTFSIDVPCGSRDRVRVEVIGGSNSLDTSENSKVWDKVAGA